MKQQKQFSLIRPVFNSCASALKTGLGAFTLVELIVVVTILAILSTIGFVSYSSYLIWVRDTNRVSNMKALSDWLELYGTKFTLPLPENKVEVKANWAVIAYQWYAWADIIESIEFSNKWKDPKDDIYYSYYLTKDKKSFQLMWFLEDEENLEAWTGSSLVVASSQEWIVDYSSRFPKVYWSKLWILTDNSNIPIQEITSIALAKKIELDTTNSWTVYSVHIKDGRTYTLTWSILNHKLYTLSKFWTYWPPKDCPDWFVASWWDSSFGQVWFCVAKYEMSYEDITTPDSCDTQNPDACAEYEDRNTVRYEEWKVPTSMRWNFPIVNIRQGQAIDSCELLWKWYHLITNNEWMTLARNIELEKENWSGWEIWNWHISNWVSRDTTLWCDTTWWNIEDRDHATKTGPWDSICNEKRNYRLFNWQEIRDLSWNVYEHVNKANTLDWADYSLSKTSISWLNSDGIYDISDMDKYGSIFYLWMSNGMWNVKYPDWIDNNIIIRWGDSTNDDSAGIFSIYLNWGEYSHDFSVGFRCAYIK